jgi:chemotaxis protein CheX
MEQLDEIDLETFISHTIRDVYETMLSMTIEPLNGSAAAIDGDRIVGSVGFAGVVMGNVSLLVSRDFARRMTAEMLGMDLEEVAGDEEIHDVIGELSNMIGGDLKSRFCDAGLPCDLSIPSITSGSDFRVEPTDWHRHERFAFQYDEQQIRVEVFVKPGK